MDASDFRAGRRAQSAIEYLTTYGWVLIIIAIAFGALYALGATNPNTYSAQECVFASGFSCLNYTMSSNGVLHLNLQQSTQNPIIVTGIACTQNGTATDFYATSNQLVTVGSNELFDVQCYTPSGAFAAQIGGPFDGSIFVNYTDQLTKFPGTAVGKIAVKVSAV
jgi:hypothetical protein